MSTLTWNDFLLGVDDITTRLRRASFIPTYIVAKDEGLILSSFLTQRMVWTPSVVPLDRLTSSVEGNVLVVAVTADESFEQVVEGVKQVLQYSQAKVKTAALVEVSKRVDWSYLQLPEAVDMPWYRRR